MSKPTAWARFRVILATGLFVLLFVGLASFTQAQQINISPRDTIPTHQQVFSGDFSRIGQIFNSPQTVVASIFRIVIAASGAIFLVLFLFGGVTYMTSAGNDESTTKAKKLMINAIVGLVIVLASFAIGTWILAQLGLSSAPATPAGGGGTGTGTGGGGTGGGTLPNTSRIYHFVFVDNSPILQTNIGLTIDGGLKFAGTRGDFTIDDPKRLPTIITSNGTAICNFTSTDYTLRGDNYVVTYNSNPPPRGTCTQSIN